MIPEIDPAALKAELDGPNPPRLLDVREADELEISKLDGVLHIPLNQLPARYLEIDRDADWVIVCRSGGRSGQATAFLKGIGYARVRNMVGGMNRYAQTVDPSLTVY